MANKICHFEIGVRDREKAAAFYSQLFDWKMEPNPAVTMMRTGDEVGGHLNTLGHEPHNYTLFYVMVDSVSESLRKAESLGGKTLVPATEVPGSKTWFGWLKDPEGNVLGVYSEKSK